jgi:hypothetical protein
MLVSHRHKFIYTKTYKTGGTSVESYFEPFCMAEGDWTLTHFRDQYVSPSGIIGYRGLKLPPGTVWWNHMPAVVIKQLLGDEVWSSYLKFCVVRNPYEKAVSAYYFWKNQNDIDQTEGNVESAQFEQWLESHGAPLDKDKFMIADQLCLDYVVRYESLHQDLEKLCARLGLLWEPARLPTFKSGIRPMNICLKTLYTERSKRIIEETYAFELSIFAYAFP